MKIDWSALAEKLDVSGGGTREAERALSEILGEEAIVDAVEHYIAGKKGAELARSVLWHIHPEAGIEHCYRIYKHDADIERRIAAVELLRVIGDSSTLKWVSEFLQSPEDGIQVWGAGLLDQLLWSHLVDHEDCQQELELMKEHENPKVTQRFKFIQSYLSERNS